MRKFCLLLLSLAAVLAVAASDTPQERYIAKWSAVAISEMQRAGIPASITLAQGLLESGAGLSSMATKGNNHFGIKCHRDWKGKKMYYDDDSAGECFRVYRSAEESFRDHSDFLRYNDRYKPLFELDPSDYKGWAHGLKKAGYATDPAYASKLIKLVEDYKLWQYDTGVPAEAIPEPPLRIEKETVKKAVFKGEHYTFSLDRPVYTRNKVLFVNSIKGESYASIAEANNLFLRELLSYNDLSSPRDLEPGTVVYLQRKRNTAAKGLDMYVFAEGETLWEICQRFAVREKSVRKLNGLPAGYVPAEGDMIKLRKGR